MSQIQNGKERVIAYDSKTLSRSQVKYYTTYCELLAVVVFVKQFKYYLYGRNFLLRTDHFSLVWLKNFKEPEGMVARWISLLDTFDTTIQHRKGSHGNADALLRVPRHRCKREDCQECKINMSCSVNAISKGNNNPSKSSELPKITQSNWVEQWDNKEILRLQQKDSNISTVMQFLINGNENPVVNTPNQKLSALLRQWNLLFMQNEILYRIFYEIDGSITNQLVAPRELRKEIMQQLNNNRTASH